MYFEIENGILPVCFVLAGFERKKFYSFFVFAFVICYLYKLGRCGSIVGRKEIISSPSVRLLFFEIE